MIKPSRGEVWLADLGQPKGHEQRGVRPVLVISDDGLNKGATELVIAIPLTTTTKNIASQILISPPEAGLKVVSVIKCEAIISISHERLSQRFGFVSDATMAKVEQAVKFLLGL